MLGSIIATFKKSSAAFEKCQISQYFEKNILLEAHRLEPRFGPTSVGPDVGSSLIASLYP